MVLVQPLPSILLLIPSMGLEKGFDNWCNNMGMPCQNEGDHGEQETVIQTLIACIVQSAVSTPYRL